ncbi:MAG: HypC/HybG/HupF family hydrogenase formation chaperone [Candidatus Hadarchaeota archaeon]
MAGPRSWRAIEMCWGVPAKVMEIEGPTATVDFGGVRKDVIVAVDGLSPGELVMVHAGIAIGRLTEEDFIRNVALYRDIRAQELLDEGLGEGEARKKAVDETDKLLGSLGIKGSIADVESEVTEKMQEAERGVQVPGNAFRSRYRISLSDTDYLQVLHYTNYFRFCERAQQELLESLGFSYATLIHKLGVFIPTVETAGKLLAPVRLDNEIEVAVWVEEVGRKHIKWRNVVKNLTSGKIAADCLTVSVCTDTTIMEAMPLPAELAEKLKKFTV